MAKTLRSEYNELKARVAVLEQAGIVPVYDPETEVTQEFAIQNFVVMLANALDELTNLVVQLQEENKPKSGLVIPGR